MLLAALAAAWVAAVPAGRAAAWPDPPAGTRALLLATGGDSGYVQPRGCHKGNGGAAYRVPFRRWLDARDATIDQVWLSTGNVARFDMPLPAQPLDAMWALFQQVGYAAVGLGTFDLDEAGGDGVVRLARRTPFPVIASNLVIQETGLPATADHVILTTRAGRVAVLGVTPHRPELVWGAADIGTVITVPPRDVLPGLIASVRPQADVVVLLSTLGSADLAELLREVRGIDVVFGQDAYLMPEEPQRHGDAAVLWLGLEGLRLGRVDLGERGRPLAFHAVHVEQEFPIDPSTGQARAALEGTPR